MPKMEREYLGITLYTHCGGSKAAAFGDPTALLGEWDAGPFGSISDNNSMM